MPVNQNVHLIGRFYNEMWNQFDKGLFPELLTEDIRFRGSLGQSAVGYGEFGQYVDYIHKAFPDFKNYVEDVVTEGDKSFARLTYRGTHRGEIFGVEPTHKAIEYAGAALFRFQDGKISAVWVLGDIYGLLQQLKDD